MKSKDKQRKTLEKSRKHVDNLVIRYFIHFHIFSWPAVALVIFPRPVENTFKKESPPEPPHPGLRGISL